MRDALFHLLHLHYVKVQPLVRYLFDTLLLVLPLLGGDALGGLGDLGSVEEGALAIGQAIHALSSLFGNTEAAVVGE